MKAAVLGLLATGCVYYSPTVGTMRASQTTTSDRWFVTLAMSAGLRSTSDAPIRCGGGVSGVLAPNSYGDGYGVGPEARCNVVIADAGARRWALAVRGMLGWSWFEPGDGGTTEEGRTASGFAGVAYELLADPERAAGEDRRPVSLDLALGLTATRFDLDDRHFSWVGVGFEAALGFDLVYYLDRTGAPR